MNARKKSIRAPRTTALGLAVGLMIGVPTASWAVSFGYMSAYEDGYLLAESSGGDVYNSGSGITEKIRFRDVRADSDGAYGVALHQGYQYGCNPGTQICYYTWRATYEDQTSRYGTASGWLTSYMSESGHGAADWRTAPKVCVDQNNEPDACGSKGYINP